MANVKVYNMKGEEVGDLELSDKVFGADYNEPLIHQAVVTYLCNQRQGTKSTLTRTEVRGGGAKPWRQKGTGRAPGFHPRTAVDEGRRRVRPQEP